DEARKLLHQAGHGCEPKSSSLLGGLRSEEWLKYSRGDRFLHAMAGVADYQANEVAAVCREGQSRRASPPGVQCTDRQDATVWHGVAGVGSQIHQDLFNLSRVGSDQFSGRI